MDRTVAGAARTRSILYTNHYPPTNTGLIICRHDQLKLEETTMEDQIKVNAEAVESLVRILSK